MPKLNSPHPSQTTLLPMRYIGVDPGVGGGLAMIEGSHQRLVSVIHKVTSCKMPATDKDVWDWFVETGARRGNTFAVIEQVHSMPKQGVASTFKFGKSFGALLMALTAAYIPYESVRPQEWQKALGIKPRDKGKIIQKKPKEIRRGEESRNEFKARLKAKAQQLFPSQKVTLHTADALLLSEYCRRKREGKL